MTKKSENEPLVASFDSEAADSAALSVASASVTELAQTVRSLQHRAIIDRDTIVGLEASLETLQQRLAKIEETDVVVAFARVDDLEDARQNLLNLLHKVTEEHRLAVAGMRRSTTWRIGSLIVKPITKVKSLGRRLR